MAKLEKKPDLLLNVPVANSNKELVLIPDSGPYGV